MRSPKSTRDTELLPMTADKDDLQSLCTFLSLIKIQDATHATDAGGRPTTN